MKAVDLRFAHAAVLSLGLAVAGCGITPETKSDLAAQVRSAEQTLANFQSDPEMRWFRENLDRAKAVIVSPRVTRAAFVVGGAGGEALVLARADDGSWRGPAFYNLGVGSLGLQIGADVSEVVILVMSEKALNSLLSRSFKLGGDATITAGPVGAGTGATPNADMVAFVRSRGAYVGLSLDGAVLSPDDGANQAFYGRAVTPVDILVRGTAGSPPEAASLQQMLMRIAS